MFMTYRGEEGFGLIDGQTYWCKPEEQKTRSGKRALTIYVGDYYFQQYPDYLTMLDDWAPVR